MWEIEREHSLNEMFVYATGSGIRVIDMWCGEHEDAERSALRISDPATARALGEILIAAADLTDRHRHQWNSNSRRADPLPWLQERAEERARERAEDPDVEHLRSMLEGRPERKADPFDLEALRTEPT